MLRIAPTPVIATLRSTPGEARLTFARAGRNLLVKYYSFMSRRLVAWALFPLVGIVYSLSE